MLKAVRAGDKITKYLASLLSARSPKNGFRSDGSFLAISKKALIARLIPSFSIRSGKIGAKKDENVSCAKCANEIVATWFFCFCFDINILSPFI
jgi:hypothetical protein